jgi:hypothetical protein
MSTQRHPQAVPLHPLRPGPTRLRLRSWSWPPLFDVFAYLFSVGSILWVGATVVRFVEAAR